MTFIAIANRSEVGWIEELVVTTVCLERVISTIFVATRELFIGWC